MVLCIDTPRVHYVMSRVYSLVLFKSSYRKTTLEGETQKFSTAQNHAVINGLYISEIISIIGTVQPRMNGDRYMIDNLKALFMIVLTLIVIAVVLGLFAAKIHCGLAYGHLPVTELPSYCYMLTR
jgi:hypothetical protein